MTLQSTGAISLNDIQSEFGGSNPIRMSEYYGVGGPNTTVPSSSSGAISLFNFYNMYLANVTDTTATSYLYTNRGTAFKVGATTSTADEYSSNSVALGRYITSIDWTDNFNNTASGIDSYTSTIFSTLSFKEVGNITGLKAYTGINNGGTELTGTTTNYTSSYGTDARMLKLNTNWKTIRSVRVTGALDSRNDPCNASAIVLPGNWSVSGGTALTGGIITIPPKSIILTAASTYNRNFDTNFSWLNSTPNSANVGIRDLHWNWYSNIQHGFIVNKSTNTTYSVNAQVPTEGGGRPDGDPLTYLGYIKWWTLTYQDT